MDYENNILEEKMKSLPPDLQAAMVSIDTSNKVQEIAERHGMHVDQAGALAEMTSLVMLGILKSKDFISELSKRAEINIDESTKIAGEINTEVFGSVRLSLQKLQGQQKSEPTPEPPSIHLINLIAPPSNHSAIEQAGQMTIEKEPVQTTQYNNPINREAVLKGIEDKPKTEIEHMPMIDHLLTTPVNTTEKVEVKVAPVEKKAPYSADPYREQM